LPREIDEQSIVIMGQFLARYGAVEFARAEDTWGFLADGSGTYELVKGIVQIARDNTKTVTLTATKTHPSGRHVGRLPFPANEGEQSRPQRPALRVLFGQHLGNAVANVQNRRRTKRVPTPARRHCHPRRLPNRLDRCPPGLHHLCRRRHSHRRLRRNVLLVDGEPEILASTPVSTSGSPTINSPSASSKKSTSTTPPLTPRPP